MKHNKYPKQTITINDISVYSLCRWASLKDAVDIVAEKCEEKRINFNEFDVKPSELLKYVENTTDVLYNKILNEVQ
jgi:hypothetical protein